VTKLQFKKSQLKSVLNLYNTLTNTKNTRGDETDTIKPFRKYFFHMLLYLYRRCTLFYTQIRITNMTVEKIYILQ